MDENKEFSRLNSLDKCPFCKEELEKGYLHVSGAWWSANKHEFPALTGEEIISPLTWTNPKVPSLRCKKCQIVISSYWHQEESQS